MEKVTRCDAKWNHSCGWSWLYKLVSLSCTDLVTELRPGGFFAFWITIEYFNWRGPIIMILSKCLGNWGLIKGQSLSLRALSKFLEADRLGAATTSLGSLGQCKTTLSVKNAPLMSRLNLPWHSFQPFPCDLSLNTREKGSAPSSPLLLKRLYRPMGYSSASFSPN